MNFDTPLVEYLIIGTHTSTWIYFVFLKFWDVPIESTSGIDTAFVLILLPFVYIIGMIFDDVVYRILRKRIKVIKDGARKAKEKKNNAAGALAHKKAKTVNPEDYNDETLANKSEVLYNAYEAKIRRVRIIGAAIFNWPLLGLAIGLNLEITNPSLIPLSVLAVSLTILSWFAWHGLYTRAYEFRLKAIDEVRRADEKRAKQTP